MTWDAQNFYSIPVDRPGICKIRFILHRYVENRASSTTHKIKLPPTKSKNKTSSRIPEFFIIQNFNAIFFKFMNIYFNLDLSFNTSYRSTFELLLILLNYFWNLFKKIWRVATKGGGWRHYSQDGSWKIDGVSKVVAVVSVSYREAGTRRGDEGGAAPLRRLSPFLEARVLSIFFFFFSSFFSLPERGSPRLS